MPKTRVGLNHHSHFTRIKLDDTARGIQAHGLEKFQRELFVKMLAALFINNFDGERTYRIVGPDEFNLREDKLSVDSPLARAMLGKRLDDEVVLNSPEGQKRFYVVEVRY